MDDAFRKSNRFAIIDRKFDDQINSEMANIGASGSSPADYAKLGQRLSADILIVPEITALSYNKSSRTLRFSGRSLNSYAGGADLNFNVVNVATGQVIFTEHFSTTFPSTPPSVYGSQVVGIGSVSAQLANLSDQFVRKFIAKNSPVSVVSLNGKSVILSQGSSMLKQGETYSAVMLGDKVKDPQTGQDLGRLETPIGTIKIVRTEEKMAFGELSGKIDAAKFQTGMIELRALVNSDGPANNSTVAAPAPTPVAGSLNKPAKGKPANKKPIDDFDAPFEN